MSSNAISAQGTLVKISTGSGGAKTITGASQGNPCVITSTAHGLSPGDRVTIASVGGMTTLNGNTYTVEYVTTNTFSLFQVNSSAYSAYTSGGTATPVTFTQIKEVKSYSGLDGQASEIDVTDMDSTAKEFRLGLKDEGSFSLNLHRLPSDAGQAALLAARDAGTSRNFTVTLPSGSPSVASFTAFVKQMPLTGAIDGVALTTVGIRITGAVAWT